jgi:hypothetical protein
MDLVEAKKLVEETVRRQRELQARENEEAARRCKVLERRELFGKIFRRVFKVLLIACVLAGAYYGWPSLKPFLREIKAYGIEKLRSMNPRVIRGQTAAEEETTPAMPEKAPEDNAPVDGA